MLLRNIILIIIIIVSGCKNVKKEFYSDGSLKAKIELNKNNQMHGKYYQYSNEGLLIVDSDYKDGLLNGVKKVYYNDGKLHWTGEYVNGIENGHFFEFDSRGFLIKTFVYKNGKLNGEYKELINDKPLLIANYRNDTVMTYFKYDSLGHLVEDYAKNLNYEDFKNLKPIIKIKSNKENFKLFRTDTIEVMIGEIPYSRIFPSINNGWIYKISINEYVVCPQRKGVAFITFIVSTDSGKINFGNVIKQVEQ